MLGSLQTLHQFLIKDDRQSKVNYRPVSLLDSLSKITEKIVFTRLYTFLLEIEYLNPLQSGFVREIQQ